MCRRCDFRHDFFCNATQGSGWGWLGYNKATSGLEIVTCANQDPLATKVRSHSWVLSHVTEAALAVWRVGCLYGRQPDMMYPEGGCWLSEATHVRLHAANLAYTVATSDRTPIHACKQPASPWCSTLHGRACRFSLLSFHSLILLDTCCESWCHLFLPPR